MITEEIIDKICISRKMRKMSLSTFPSWVDSVNLEGLEFKGGKLLSFWIKDNMTKIYDEPPSPQMEKTINLILVENTGDNGKGTDNGEDKNKGNTQVDTKFVNCLPDVYSGKRIIVPQDIDELKKMTTFDRILLFQKTPPSIIKEKIGRGGKKQKYVEGNIMKLEANIAFLFCISSKIDGWQIDEKGVSCYGSMKVNIDGKEVIVSDVGFDLQEYKRETKEPVFTVHEMMKNACTDMKKRCLAAMGFNGDVYRGEV